MTLKKYINYAFIAMMLILANCKKENTVKPNGTVSGKARVDGQVVHHYYGISNCRLFVKQNAASFPGSDTTLYNFALTTDGQGYFIIENMANGDYCFYALGYDVMVADSVWGYQFLKINNAPGEEKSYSISIPVSETH